MKPFLDFERLFTIEWFDRMNLIISLWKAYTKSRWQHFQFLICKIYDKDNRKLSTKTQNSVNQIFLTSLKQALKNEMVMFFAMVPQLTSLSFCRAFSLSSAFVLPEKIFNNII